MNGNGGLLREKGSICSDCGEEQDVYLVHDIPVFEGGDERVRYSQTHLQSMLYEYVPGTQYFWHLYAKSVTVRILGTIF